MNSTFSQHMIAILNGPVIDEHNTKLMLIKRIFERLKYLGTDDRMRKQNKNWDGETFDNLYARDNEFLDRYDNDIEQLCIAHHKTTMALMSKQNELKGMWYGKE